VKSDSFIDQESTTNIIMPSSIAPRALTDENGLIDPAVPFPMIVILIGMIVIVVGAILRDVLTRPSTG